MVTFCKAHYSINRSNCTSQANVNGRYAHYRARKLGLPPPNLNPFSKKRREPSNYRAPAPAPGGVQGWISDKWNSLTSGRTAGGAYEGASYAGGSGSYGGQRRGFGPLDPDEAWDARVDNETNPYYEEQELGLQDHSHGPYGGGGYGDVSTGGGYEGDRGRSRSRDGRTNPFGDNADASSMSLRDVSPRPDALNAPSNKQRGPSHKRGQSSLGTTGSADDSPTERRSMFREDV